MSVLIFVTQDRPMGSGTSVGSTKPFCCQNIFNGNIYLNIYLNDILTTQNGLMTLILLAEKTPTELKLVRSSITCFLDIGKFLQFYTKIFNFIIQ